MRRGIVPSSWSSTWTLPRLRMSSAEACATGRPLDVVAQRWSALARSGESPGKESGDKPGRGSTKSGRGVPFMVRSVRQLNAAISEVKRAYPQDCV